jgi:hypothetical protein
MSEANEFSEAEGKPSIPGPGTSVKDYTESDSCEGAFQRFFCLYKTRGRIQNVRQKFTKLSPQNAV